MKSYKDRMINIDELETNAVQPPARVAGEHKALRASLEMFGQLRGVMVAELPDGRFVLTDGHRTVEAARELGWKQVACSVTKMSAAQSSATFSATNVAQRNMTGGQHLYAWAVSADRDAQLVALGKRAAQIKAFVKVFGLDDAVELGRTGVVDPSIVGLIGKVSRSIARYETPYSDRAIGKYIIKNKASVAARFAATFGSKRQVLRLATCIKTGKPFVLRTAAERK